MFKTVSTAARVKKVNTHIGKKTASLTAQFDKIADSLADPDGPIQSFEQKNAAMMTLLKTAYTNFTHSKKTWKVENKRLRDELLEKTDEGISKLNEQTRERLAVTMDRVGKYLSENSELIAGMEGKADHELTEKERLVKNLLATAQKAEQALAGEEAALRGRLADDTAAKGALGSAEAAIAALRRGADLFFPPRGVLDMKSEKTKFAWPKKEQPKHGKNNFL